MIPLKKDKEPENKKAVFNMAINTLQRLGDMLEEISKLTHETFLDQMTRQRMKADLVKQFYVQATPLLPKDKIENYSKKILTLKPTPPGFRPDSRVTFFQEQKKGTKECPYAALGIYLREMTVTSIK